jgi:hypothetical protein
MLRDHARQQKMCGHARAPAAAGDRPKTVVKGSAGVRLALAVTFEGGRKHLPVVMLWPVA